MEKISKRLRYRSGSHMTSLRMRFSGVALTVLIMCCLTNADAQSYPDRPIRLIVGYAPGGGTDLVARLVGPYLGRALGQSIVIENNLEPVGQLLHLMFPNLSLMDTHY
jgi:hypothetical protein